MSDMTLDAKKARLTEVTTALERSKVELKRLNRNSLIVVAVGALGCAISFLKIFTNMTGYFGMLTLMFGMMLILASGLSILLLEQNLNKLSNLIEKLSADEAELKESIAEAEKKKKWWV